MCVLLLSKITNKNMHVDGLHLTSHATKKLQVSNCINKICRRMGCIKDISLAVERSRLPLYYIPQVLDAVCDALSMSVHAKIAGFTVKVLQTSKYKRKQQKDGDSNKSDIGNAMDINGVLKESNNQPQGAGAGKSYEDDEAAAALRKKQRGLLHLDQGSLW